MKKLILFLLAFGLVGALYAANTPVASGPSVLTSAVINGLAPSYAGQLVFCSDCVNQNINKGTLCTSSGTAAGAWIIACSSAATTTACK